MQKSVKNHMVRALGAVALALATTVALPSFSARAEGIEARIIKNPNCGCCTMHGEYLREHGFDVTITNDENVYAMATMIGIPEDMQGCHLTMIDGYAVSGHVPVETILRMLEERPAITALTLPGMPMGSPGMGGAKEAPFEIYSLKNGKAEIYELR
ncbi:DUF411 domain-containing protein [Thalassospira sp. GO-4]|jgi:hypothetical protein|uniref:DUF411 domain-containing protein n=1 Tax=Thalassospira sp. GO-4 TaxID=2946605 RepID=UPI000DED8C24|nr:DUF411 domain-containing protein [Thalassospira sp. GO-4]RCK26826.1 hypothetical protein TH8_09000 [Thalassospira profundimaris]URK17368.1 DUF411 domain-containing protein [Thalassospira sp. GO-4]